MNPVKRKILYHTFSFISNFLYMLVFWIYKFTIFGVIILIFKYFENQINGIKFIAFILGLFASSLMLKFFEKKTYLIEKIEKKAKQYKSYPFTEKYGSDFPEPLIEQFGLKNINFKEYREIRQLSDHFFPFTIIYLISLFFFHEFISNFITLKLQLIVSISFYLLAYIIVKISDKKRIQNYKYYNEIKKYQKEMSKYHKIENEKRLKRFNK